MRLSSGLKKLLVNYKLGNPFVNFSLKEGDYESI